MNLFPVRISTTFYAIRSVLISSCECKKVVTDILAKNSFLLSIENTFKTHILSFTPGHKPKNLQSDDRNTISENNEKQRKFEHKMASPEKSQKCK